MVTGAVNSAPVNLLAQRSPAGVATDCLNPLSRACRYGGILFPFALNFSPNAVSSPPPLGLVWQTAQDLCVSAANLGVAEAGWDITRAMVLAATIAPAASVNAL